jgi:hypothetical protein
MGHIGGLVCIIVNVQLINISVKTRRTKLGSGAEPQPQIALSMLLTGGLVLHSKKSMSG